MIVRAVVWRYRWTGDTFDPAKFRIQFENAIDDFVFGRFLKDSLEKTTSASKSCITYSYFAISTFFGLMKESNVDFRTECEMRSIEIVDVLLGQILERREE